MREFTEDTLTDAVVRSFEACGDPRLKEVLASLVRHIHGFVREVEPSEAEWMAAIRFLTRTGHTCDERRQEFILLSDALGISMLVDAVNHRAPEGATESTVQGPFYVERAPEFERGADISGGVPGEPLFIEATVRSADGKPIAGATVDVWQSDDEGRYDLQRPDLGEFHLRGRFRADEMGRVWLWSIVPRFYPIPDDGPVGELLRASGRHPFRPAHVHFLIEAPGHERLVTHVFVEGDPYLDSDAVFAVKRSLVRKLETRASGTEPDGKPIGRAHAHLAYDFTLRPVSGVG
jgi:hydroxyquinol 1,2-dioxygenase